MKRTLLIATLVGAFITAFGQNDTIFYLDFESGVMPTNFVDTQDTADITVWQNYSLDSIPSANGLDPNWFLGPGIANVDTSNTVIASTSWLEGFAPGNRNYLISPAFFLVDDWTNLSWYSASRHAPIYLDGYSVVASTTGSRPEDFTDTLFRAAQWIGSNPNPTTDSPVPVFNNHRYSEGWVHGYDGTYLEIDGDSLNWRCVLQPHTVSLSQYEGMNVRIAFVHDSDDDNIISLDKILLRGTKIIGLEEEEALRADVYPNPAVGSINLRFTTEELSACTWKLHDLQGKVVSEGQLGTLMPGTHTVEVDLAGLSSGTYLLHYQVGSTSDSREIIVH